MFFQSGKNQDSLQNDAKMSSYSSLHGLQILRDRFGLAYKIFFQKRNVQNSDVVEEEVKRFENEYQPSLSNKAFHGQKLVDIAETNQSDVKTIENRSETAVDNNLLYIGDTENKVLKVKESIYLTKDGEIVSKVLSENNAVLELNVVNNVNVDQESSTNLNKPSTSMSNDSNSHPLPTSSSHFNNKQSTSNYAGFPIFDDKAPISNAMEDVLIFDVQTSQQNPGFSILNGIRGQSNHFNGKKQESLARNGSILLASRLSNFGLVLQNYDTGLPFGVNLNDQAINENGQNQALVELQNEDNVVVNEHDNEEGIEEAPVLQELPNMNDLLINEDLPANASVTDLVLDDDNFRQMLWISRKRGFEEFCTLIIEDKEIKAIKSILTSQSDVFERMFSISNTIEAKSNTVTIRDVKADIMESFLEYLYRGKIESLDELALELIVVADKYNVRKLKSDCIESLGKLLDEESFFDCMVLAYKHNIDKLKQYVLEFVQHRPKKMFLDLLTTDKWADIVQENRQLSKEIMTEVFQKCY